MADVDGDGIKCDIFFLLIINSLGKKDIVVAAYDGTIAVYDYDGNFLDGWPVTVTDGNEVSL